LPEINLIHSFIHSFITVVTDCQLAPL